ncbi:hypothetical protein MRB53_028697 [Persea americana]|uniref:Uncharacterized protein n=1 Tax=Persea americana TaxID=3435 RepID=A0ACC2KGF5_PERAE|nr:hypothetical protein MRB53_028697 [Persea americana]
MTLRTEGDVSSSITQLMVRRELLLPDPLLIVPSRSWDMLMSANGYHGSDYPSVNMRPVGLGISWGDGGNWVKPFQLCGCFSAESSWESRTNHILQINRTILKEVEICDAVRAFWKTVVFSNEAFMAMLESFLPQTNTFIVMNGDIGFFFKELSAITGLSFGCLPVLLDL